VSNVVIHLDSNLNINFDHAIETDISVDEWSEMSRDERLSVLTDALWENVNAEAMDEDGEYLD
jgi:hypothetical protein